MTIVVERPVFLQDKRCHEVRISQCDLRLMKEVSTAAELPIDFLEDSHQKSELDSFLRGFLESSKGFFSKPLDPDLFRYRLVHFWDGLESVSTEQVRARVCWVPASVLFYPNRYELHWEIADFEELPEITNLSGQAETQLAQSPPEPEPEPESAPPPSQELSESEPAVAPPVENPPDLLADAEILDSLPFEASGPALAGPATRSRERQRIRRARLKAALAQLRAERLAERYYDRYGTLEDIEGDSSLSSGSNSESESPQKQG